MSQLSHKIGWIGAGRMGYAMAERLLRNGVSVRVFNRTRSKAEPLSELGAEIADTPSELADCDIVFTMVSTSNDLLEVISGEVGVLSGSARPKILVDCSSVSEDASAAARSLASEVGVQFLAAPVSGNAKCVKAGKLTIVSSGPKETFDIAEPYLELLGRGVTYVGEGELSRIVKICHNLILGVVTQSLAETTVLAEKHGVSRAAYLEFINDSVMGSIFSRYKTPAFVNLDMTATFTPSLLRKDLDLGLDAGRKLKADMPLTQLTRDLVDEIVAAGQHDSDDFAVLLLQQAEKSGLNLESENVDVDDGLSSTAQVATAAE